MAAEDRLLEGLNPDLEHKVRPLFYDGDYETAAFAALNTVEVRVRDLAGLSDSTIGVQLMRRAFNEGGALRDAAADPMADLFAGAIGTFKNPSSHRVVHFDDPTEAAEVVLLADLLLRLLDRVERRLAPLATTEDNHGVSRQAAAG